MAFFVYILRCADGSYYTGHTDNLEISIAGHRAGDGSDWTKTRLPVAHVWSQEFVTREEALVSERRIKGWARAKKEALIAGRWDKISRLARSSSPPALRQAQDERGGVESDKATRPESVEGGARSEKTAGPELIEGREAVLVGLQAIQAILTHAAQTHPHECCGLLLGEGATIAHAHPTANVHPEPARHFEIDPAALIAAHKAQREGASQVVGYYHSHPTGDPHPSATDRRCAAHDGKVWAIVAPAQGNWEIRFFRDGEEEFVPLPYTTQAR